MKICILDCFSGISGNMFLGSLVDAGLPLEVLEERLGLLHLRGWSIKISKKKKNGINGLYLEVREHNDNLESQNKHEHQLAHEHKHELAHKHKHEHEHEHEHKHTHAPHRHWADIQLMIKESGLSDEEKALSFRIFLRIAEAESKAHGVDIDSVHFHEVGAVDSIIDVVGAACGWLWLKEHLQIQHLYSSGTNLGGGTVFCQHGEMPVPAPATASILEGVPVWSRGDFEMTTPTGAAILAELVDHFELPDRWTTSRIGLGCGTKEATLPNMLRLLIGESSSSSELNKNKFEFSSNDLYLQIEAVVDDMTGELAAHARDQLLVAGALEVLLINANNKGRPALLFRILLKASDFDSLSALLFKETTTIGFRYYEVKRVELDRHQLKPGAVSVKQSFNSDGERVNVKPEFRELEKYAREKGCSVKSLIQDSSFLTEIYKA